jgi:transcriptional regulator with XRE-family HTH domain
MKSNSSFAERLITLKERLKIKSQQEFSDRVGITKGNYNSYLKGVQPSLDKLVNILTNVENLNPNWLIKGEGEMFLPQISSSKNILNEKEIEYKAPDKLIYEQILLEKEKQISKLMETNDKLVKNNGKLSNVIDNLANTLSKKNTADTA